MTVDRTPPTPDAQPQGVPDAERPVRNPLGIAWRNVGFIATAIVLVSCVVGAFDPPRFNWGDTGSSYNVMIAGRNFARYGFINLRLTPVLLDRAAMIPADSDMVYTHYPQLPDLMNGVLRAAFGMTKEVQFRLVALAFSFGSLVFIYGLIARYWSRQTAQIALALWVTNPLWIQHADYLHHSPYGAFFGIGAMFFLARSFREPNRRAYLVISGVGLFLTYASSYDYWIFVPLLLAAMTVGHYRAVFVAPVIRTLAFLAAFAVGAILCKLAVNIWVLGGIAPFLKDLRFQSVEHYAHSTWYLGLWPTLRGRVERFFSLLLYPLVGFWMVFPLVRKRLARRVPPLDRLINPLPLLLVALPFLWAFRELFVGEYYPALMVIPFYAVGFAAVAQLLFESGHRAAKAVAVVLLVAVMSNALDEDLRFKKAFFDPEAIRTLRTQLDTLARPGQRILANQFFEWQYRYYFDRRLLPVIIDPPFRIEAALAHYAAPSSVFTADSRGAILVQHKHVTDELFDKAYGLILVRYNLWDAWANPPRYRRFIDSLVLERDSAITKAAALHGKKLYESDFYVLWRIFPTQPKGGSANLPVIPARR